MRWTRSDLYVPPRRAKVELARAIKGDWFGVPKYVGFIPGGSSHLSSRRPIERDSYKTYGFSTQKTRIGKGLRTSTNPVNCVVIRSFDRRKCRRVIRLYNDAELSQWLILIFAARCRTLMQAAGQNIGCPDVVIL